MQASAPTEQGRITFRSALASLFSVPDGRFSQSHRHSNMSGIATLHQKKDMPGFLARALCGPTASGEHLAVQGMIYARLRNPGTRASRAEAEWRCSLERIRHSEKKRIFTIYRGTSPHSCTRLAVSPEMDVQGTSAYIDCGSRAFSTSRSGGEMLPLAW